MGYFVHICFAFSFYIVRSLRSCLRSANLNQTVTGFDKLAQNSAKQAT